MELLIISFLSGVLTVFAPCVFTLLPITLGSSLKGGGSIRSVRIIVSLIISIFIFTLLLKVSTLFLGISYMVWRVISGGIILLYGVITLYPLLWENLKSLFSRWGKVSSNESKEVKAVGTGWVSDMLIGASLGPIFSSCSPTYALIIAIILPVSFLQGLTSLSLYLIGLGSMLFLIAYFGNRLTLKFTWMLDPNGWFRKTLGVIFIIIGILIVFGIDKSFETYLIREGIYEPSRIEMDYIQKIINR